MKKRGFTLVEIMIVVAIIALLAAIAIPNLLNARKQGNMAAAKANVKAIVSELEVYAAGVGDGSYPTDYANTNIGASTKQYCADITGTIGTDKGGYTYKCTSTTGTTYSIAAVKDSAATGDKNYTGTTGGQLIES